MAAIGHRITMQMCCEQGGGNIGEVEEVLNVDMRVLVVLEKWNGF